jgi:hypothetical protein
VLMMYFVKNEKAAEKWWLMKKDDDRRQWKMRDILGLTNNTYGLLSNYYAHPTELKSLMPTILSESDEGKKEYHRHPYYLRDECQYCFALWIHFANETIQQLQIVFKAAQIGNKVWMRKVLEVQNLASENAKETGFELRRLAEGKQEGE